MIGIWAWKNWIYTSAKHDKKLGCYHQILEINLGMSEYVGIEELGWTHWKFGDGTQKVTTSKGNSSSERITWSTSISGSRSTCWSVAPVLLAAVCDLWLRYCQEATACHQDYPSKWYNDYWSDSSFGFHDIYLMTTPIPMAEIMNFRCSTKDPSHHISFGRSHVSTFCKMFLSRQINWPASQKWLNGQFPYGNIRNPSSFGWLNMLRSGSVTSTPPAPHCVSRSAFQKQPRRNFPGALQGSDPCGIPSTSEIQVTKRKYGICLTKYGYDWEVNEIPSLICFNGKGSDRRS